jgi:hypothetical protein
MRALLPLLLLTACPPVAPDVDLPDALVAADRSGHWLDRPFPSDELRREDGTVDWTILPDAPIALGTTIVSGWAAQASAAAQGFSHQSAVYLRFEAEPTLQEGDVGITGPDGDVPVEHLWIDDPAGDPFLAPRTLVVMPTPTSPLRSGATYVAWVSDRAADPPPDWTPPDGAPEHVAVATSFTVQPSLGQLEALDAAADAWVDADPSRVQPTDWRHVTHFRYEQGATPSGEDATVATVTYEDGSASLTYLAPEDDDSVRDFDLTTWSHEVWEGHVLTAAFQEEEGRPWARPGIGLVGDFGRLDEGWIEFDGEELLSEPRPESMRIVVQIPRTPGPHPVVTWDHGTGGHAYNAVARTNPGDRSAEITAALGSTVIVSRDQPLYGQRYPLIDEGFGASIGFYNLGNLPAFRDNQRQATVDHRVLYRFVQEGLGAIADVDTDRVGAFGHSLGSVTAHGALAGQQGRGPSSAFLSGTGGYLAFYVLDSGLLGTGNDVVNTVAPLVGLTEEQLASATPAEVVAALIGLPESAWPNMGRQHPVMQLFGTIMDPSDPLMFARDQVVPETLLLGLGDLQVPERTTRWLAEVTPDATLIECTPGADYDGHWCLFWEDVGIEALRAWAEGL